MGKVLVVDDDEFVLETLTMLLSEEYDVIGANCGIDATDVLRTTEIAVLLSDLVLPDMTGMELLTSAQTLNPSVVCVLLTGYGTKENAIHALRRGAFDFLEKPVQPELLLHTVANAHDKWIREHQNIELMERLQGTLRELSSANTELEDEIAQRRVAQDAATQSRDLYRSILTTSLDAIIGCNGAGKIIEWAGRAESIFGWSAEEVLGKNAMELIIPGDLADEQRAELLLYRTTGKSPLMDNRIHTLGKHQSGGVFPIELSLTSTPVPGDIIFTAYIRDLTHQQSVETALREREEQLRQQAKMEAVGRLAGAVAHDFNNVLSVILSYTEMFQDELDESSEMFEMARDMYEAGLQASSTTKQLLAFSRKQLNKPVPVDVNATLSAMRGLLSQAVGESVDLAWSLTPGAGSALIDKNLFEQAILNLVANARDAIGASGTIQIETSRSVDGPVVISVIDNGCGIDDVTRDRMFEPFFTTKEEGKGTGLGLSTVYGAVNKTGGHITVDSDVGRGTTISLVLPSTAPSAPSRTPRRTRAGNDNRGHETILLVEDEDMVRHVAIRVLERAGYTVLSARNAGEAIVLFEESRQTIDMLLTDVVMPHMSGPSLADRLLRRAPKLPVLFMSGYTNAHLTETDSSLLYKPFTPGSLLQAIRNTMDENTSEGTLAPESV